jgi:hypothetical protein
MEQPLKIAHIVNVTEIDESKHASYLHVAQPLTLKTMVIAARMARPVMEVELWAIKHRSERVTVPPEIRWAPDIERYGWEFFDELRDLPRPKPLPRIRDIIAGLDAVSDAEYFVYTNLDIGLNPDFYLAVRGLIQQGYDAFCINRRTLPTRHEGVLLDEHTAELVFRVPGEEHGGIDCFVFKKSIVPKLQLGDVFIGLPPIGQVLKTQIETHSKRFSWVRDRSLTFHLGDDRVWDTAKRSPYGDANLKAAQGLFYKCFSDRQATQRPPLWLAAFNKLRKNAARVGQASKSPSGK